jgi:hypothetical protein
MKQAAATLFQNRCEGSRTRNKQIELSVDVVLG